MNSLSLNPRFDIFRLNFPKELIPNEIYEKWSNIKYQYRNREFWCKGYYVDTVGKNSEKITAYIRNQLKVDQEAEQLTMDLNDPFTGK